MRQVEPTPPAGDEDAIAIVVLTHNRVHLLRNCVENVLMRTSPATSEIVIWDNASTDGTSEYLESLRDSRVRVLTSDKNVGQNGYAHAFRQTRSPLMVELDDDVVDAPSNWDLALRDAFLALPEVGFLAADLEDDPHDEASNVRHHVRPHLYTPDDVNGVKLLRGPTGGGCAMTSRALYERVGGFQEHEDRVFWLEDEAYIQDIEALGLQAAVLASLRVHHTGGPYYSTPIKEKTEYWQRRNAARARRDKIKRILLEGAAAGAPEPTFPLVRRAVVSDEPNRRSDVMLVCSSGGHLLQLVALGAAWRGYSRTWVTFDKSDARSLLADEDVVFAYGPTNRNVRNLIRNLWLAARVVRRIRPRVLITTGAGVAVPFAWMARLHGARVVYVESLTRISERSLSCRLIAPVAERRYAQWPELTEVDPGMRFVGSVFTSAS